MKTLDLRTLKLRGRSKEFASLQDAYNQVKDSSCTSCEVVMVQGYSGTGKSSLVNKLKSTIQESECGCGYFVSGKFDQQKTTEPYHALAAAFNDLCDLIVASGDKELAKKSFLEQVDSKGKVLLDVVPKLSQLIGDLEGDGRRCIRRDSLSKGLSQLKYVLRAFVRTVCTVSQRPIVLFLDDLQWADVASLELLESLTTDSESKRILFIGTYRDNEVDEKHPLTGHLRSVGNQKHIHIIQLHNLDLETVNEVISSVTQLDPSVTKPLTDVVYRKTQGNIFFVLKFLQMLQEEDLLYFSIKTYKWAWDPDKIKTQTNLSDNVVELVKDKIQRLPTKTQAALKLAACLWSTFEVKLLKDVMLIGAKIGCKNSEGNEYKDIICSDDDLVSLLDEAAEEVLLDKLSENSYKFAHDRIRQAAYSLIPEGEERERFHHWIGEALWDMTESPPCEEWVYFAAADQMNHGARLVTDEKTRVGLAKLNLLVAEKAIMLSSFVPALSYLKSGIGHIPVEKKWIEHYDLSLKLYSAMADMEHCTGNWEQMQEVVGEIMANAKCFEDKISALDTLGLSLLSQSKQSEVIQLCYGVLNELGEPLPKRITKTSVALESRKLKRLLGGKTDQDLLQLPQMTEESKLNAGKFLDTVLNCRLYLGMMRDVSLVAIRLMMLTLRFGLCDQSPLAFVLWGNALVEKRSFEEGYRFGKLAMKLVDRLDSKFANANVVAFAYGFIIHWKEPLPNTLDPVLDAHKNAMLNGDIHWAFQCIVGYQMTYLSSGLPLQSGTADLIAFCNLMKDYNQDASRRLQCPVLQMMLNLMGRYESDVLVLTGEVMDQDEFENIETNPHRIGVQAIASCRMQLAYYFGDLELAAELSKQLQSISKASVFSASYLVCVRTMFFGLISIALARKTKKRKHAADALRIISMMEEKWVKHGAINCLHKFLLLKAEYSTLKGTKSDEVRKAFDNAISTARRIGFIQDQALANERAGMFCLSLGDDFWASSYLSRAHSLYEEWGAQAKADQLRKDHGLLLSTHEFLHSSHLRGRARFSKRSSLSHKSLNSSQIFEHSSKSLNSSQISEHPSVSSSLGSSRCISSL